MLVLAQQAVQLNNLLGHILAGSAQLLKTAGQLFLLLQLLLVDAGQLLVLALLVPQLGFEFALHALCIAQKLGSTGQAASHGID